MKFYISPLLFSPSANNVDVVDFPTPAGPENNIIFSLIIPPVIFMNSYDLKLTLIKLYQNLNQNKSTNSQEGYLILCQK